MTQVMLNWTFWPHNNAIIFLAGRVYLKIQTKILLPLILIFGLMSGLVILLNYSNQQTFVERFIEEQAFQTASQYFDSVNAMMITGTMENREILRNKLLENKDIEDIKIVRGDKVKDMYGDGFSYESTRDELDERGLKGEEIKIIQSFKGKRTLTVLLPVLASSNYRGTNCLECHEVPEGTVLGATRITYSLNRLDQEVKENSIYVGKIMIALFIVALLIVLGVLRIIAVRRVKLIQQDIELISQNMDLTKTLRRNNSKDEIAKMANAFDEMLKTIRESLFQVKNSTSEIVMGTEEISNITSLTVSDIIQQKEEINSVGQTIRKMSASSQNVADSTHKSQSFTNNVEGEVADGANKAFSAQQKINNLYLQIEQVSAIAEKLEIETQRIAESVKVVDDITMKTRLLSFNASVEAGRAGQAGLGFSVVANEIGELAQQTKESNLEIGECTDQLKKLMHEAVIVIRETKTLATEGRNEVNTSYEAFKNVAVEMSKLKDVMINIAGSTKEQSEATREVEDNIQSIMNLSNKTTVAAHRIGEVSSDFSRLANELDKLINQFKI